jgi:hypothetical protein
MCQYKVFISSLHKYHVWHGPQKVSSYGRRVLATGSSAWIGEVMEEYHDIFSISGSSKMGKILLWLQERVKHWTKPAISVLIIGTILDLTRSRTDLVVENALLRQQLIVLNRQVKRPQLTNFDRFRLVFLSHFTKFWKQALHIV